MNKKQVIYVASALILILIAYFTYTTYFKKDADIAAIQTDARKYFDQNHNYGFETKPGNINNCAAANTFLRDADVSNVFAKEGVEQVSCQFKIENGILTAWSVTLVKNGTAYCGDSTGTNKITPGITTTANCDAN